MLIMTIISLLVNIFIFIYNRKDKMSRKKEKIPVKNSFGKKLLTNSAYCYRIREI